MSETKVMSPMVKRRKRRACWVTCKGDRLFRQLLTSRHLMRAAYLTGARPVVLLVSPSEITRRDDGLSTQLGLSDLPHRAVEQEQRVDIPNPLYTILP